MPPPRDPSTTLSSTHLSSQWDRDPRNARNWSTIRKFSTCLIISSIGFTSTLATSIYSPGTSSVAHEFRISHTVALLPLSTYALGMGFGPTIASPLSEMLGRRFVYLATTPVFAAFILGSGFCKSIASLCVCRFFAGFFGAPAVSIASATIADMFAPDRRGVPLAMYYCIPFLGSLGGPMVGGFVVEAKGWRWTQWTTLLFAAAVFPLLYVFVRESYRKVLIRNIARRERLEAPLLPDSSKIVRYFFTTTVARPVHMLVTEPIVGLVCVYGSFQFALLYTFITGSPYVFAVTYGFDVAGQSLSFLGLIVGAIVAGMVLVAMDYYIYQAKCRHFRSTTPVLEFPPEYRLYPSMLGSIILPAGLFFFAWTAQPHIHWIVPIIAQAITILGSITVYASSNIYMVDTYGPLYGASAAGANSLTRYTLTASFPLFTLQLFKHLGVNWGASLLGFCTLAMAPIPWVFWRWGPQLRGRSRYEREV